MGIFDMMPWRALTVGSLVLIIVNNLVFWRDRKVFFMLFVLQMTLAIAKCIISALGSMYPVNKLWMHLYISMTKVNFQWGPSLFMRT